jgi:hypothetical protein
LDVTIEGKPIAVTVNLSYEQASDLAILLEPFTCSPAREMDVGVFLRECRTVEAYLNV